MTLADQRAAQAALEAARPAAARLDPARHAEENAADIIELWTSIETALRSLLGGSVLSGQALIRELRQREMLSLDQAHALLELLAVRERVDRTDYQPTPADIAAARDAVAALGQAASTPAAAAAPPASEAGKTQPMAAAPTAAAIEYMPPAEPARSRGPGLAIALVFVALVIVAAAAYWFIARRPAGSSQLAQGIAAYEAGQREQARSHFEQATRENQELALPHVYLGRIAREEGDWGTAGRELAAAVQRDTASALARRELASFFLARAQQNASRGRPDLATPDLDAARRNYVAAIQLDPTDKVAQGYLGCTLIRAGRVNEGMNWLNRAGPGGWSACAPATTTSPTAGTTPPPAP